MNKGFSLVELLAAIFILSIIVVLAVPILSNRIDKFKEKNFNNMVKNIESVTSNYVNDNRKNLKDLDYFGFINVSIQTLVSKGYLGDSLINPLNQEPIPLSDIVYITLDYKNKINIIYDPYQNEKDRITLNGLKNITIKQGSTYTEYGAVAIDKDKNNVSSKITISGSVSTSIEGVYKISYFTDNSLVIERYVTVTSDFQKEDIEKPVLTSDIPGNYIKTIVDNDIVMPVVTATDNVDGVINSISPSSNNVDINNIGTYYIKYNFTDSSSNKADTLIIKVVVTP